MSQDATPLMGGRSSIKTSTPTPPGTYVSEQFAKAKNLNLNPTEWTLSGRPIYDRLPAASTNYRTSFGFDDSQAYVYVPPGISRFGTNSLEVVSSGDDKYLVIKGGTAVWKYGSVDFNPVIINLQEIGMKSTRYLLAYQFFIDDAPFDSLYSVENYSLQGYPMKVSSNTDTVPGWRYKSEFAFCNNLQYEWRNYDGLFPNYSDNAVLTWIFPNPGLFSTIKLRCPSGTAITGTATLSLSKCVTGDPENPYCDSPDFVEHSTVPVMSDSDGQFFEFNIADPTLITGWSIQWSDPKIAINQVFVTGSLNLRRKPEVGRIRTSLVAYPQNAVPKVALDSEGKEVPAVYCNLAIVDTSREYTVTKIQDAREVVNTTYQPISDWLTLFWDRNLMSLYSQTQDYSNSWMSPTQCLKKEYDKLSELNVAVSE